MVRVVAVGDNDVDCYLSTGLMYPGGNCLNVAVFARRFGAESAFIGAMADDAAGRHMQGALTQEGVATDRLRIVPGLTAYCVIGHMGAERVFLTHDLGVSRFVPTDSDLAALAKFDAAHVGQSSGLDPWVPAIAEQTRLSYDFSTRLDSAHMRRTAPHCWLATISGGDRSLEEIEALADDLRRHGAEHVLATMGRRGALLLTTRDRYFVSAQPVEAVDTLGAGDAFIARTLVGLLREENSHDILDAATQAAAETCLYIGAIGHGAPIDLPVDLGALDLDAMLRAAQ